MELLKLNELTKKKLDDTYIVVYAIKNEINIKKADIIEKNDIYTLIGVDTKGIRHLLNIYADKVNNSHFWLDVDVYKRQHYLHLYIVLHLKV